MSTIEHVAIFARNLESLKDFYCEALDLRVVLDNTGAPVPGYFLRGAGGSALEIIQRPDSAETANQRFVCHVAFFVDAFGPARARLERHGARFETDTAVDNSSVQTAFFADPEGNRGQIIWRREPLAV
jgi:glyoxylase I family protein